MEKFKILLVILHNWWAQLKSIQAYLIHDRAHLTLLNLFRAQLSTII